jgi:hypothetical protein
MAVNANQNPPVDRRVQLWEQHRRLVEQRRTIEARLATVDGKLAALEKREEAMTTRGIAWKIRTALSLS